MNQFHTALIVGAWTMTGHAGLSTPAQAACAAGAEPRTKVEVMFGRNVGDRFGVTDAAWRRFLDRDVTPRFPRGFTVHEAWGRWRDPRSGRIVRELSKVLTIATSDDPSARARVRDVADAYKSRFRQQSVGIVEHQACISF